MRWLTALVVVVMATVLPVAVGAAQAQEAQEAQSETCPHERGWKPKDLPGILADHRDWVARWRENRFSRQWAEDHPEGKANLCKADLRRANLTDADLGGANLTDADLGGANLTDAVLRRATLTHADLGGANLTGANLHGANLTGANLRGANLADAFLLRAALTDAVLRHAKLTNAVLFLANLTDADLTLANLTDADLAFANLMGAIYAPGSPPPDAYVADIWGLRTIVFTSGQETGLVQLRELLQKAGLRDLEREATYAIERGRTWHAICEEPKYSSDLKSSDLRLSILECHWKAPSFGFAEGVFRFVAFELTTAYGHHPGRALIIIIVLWGLLIPVYAWAIFRVPHWLDSPGIYRIWPKERVEASAGRLRLSDNNDIERLSERDWRAITYAAYFSLLSAFHIGWRDLSIGTWITRAQPREYTLKPTGWVRLVSGLQSLLSVYLLAIWALTYFGRPFQ